MIFNILGRIADVLSLLALWGFDKNSALEIRIGITIFIVILIIILSIMDCYSSKVVDYFWVDDERPTLFIKKNKYFRDNALVSIYMREDNKAILVAIGFVISESGERRKNIQINVFKYIDENTLRRIKVTKKNHKKFFVKPDVRYSDISGIDFRETEEGGNNV